ncbi:MAG: TRAM domain-containing protein [Bacteroidia bacterium]
MKRRAFYTPFEGQTRNVLFEGKEDDGKMFGFTDNYIKVVAAAQDDYINQIVPATLTRINADGMMEVNLPVTYPY